MMTNQEKKTYLNRYRLLDQQVQRTVDELTRWRSRAEKMTPQYGENQTGGGEGDQVQSAVERMMELEEEANQKIDELLLLRKEIEKAIATVPDATERLLLAYRYIDGRTWEAIAEQMNYTERWVYRLHERALSGMEL